MYKTLLVPVDGRSKSARSLELAGRIAREFDAHLVGLFVKPLAYIPSPAQAAGTGEMLEEMLQKSIQMHADAAREQFDAAMKASGASRSEWRTTQGDRVEKLSVQARYADLVVLNQTDPRAPDATHFADSVLLSVGRPVLLVPYVGDIGKLAHSVLVCWNASREAARAVTDALPLLKRAAKVTVMTVDGQASSVGHGESPGSDVALYLARHGVKAEVMQTTSGEVEIGNLILSRAFDLGADLIVMGAYGHSRVREIVLGGATRTILGSMTVPVLMSH